MIRYCEVCSEELVHGKDRYQCDGCEEIYCQSCYMDEYPSYKKYVEKGKQVEDSDGEMSYCVFCRYDIPYEESPHFKK